MPRVLRVVLLSLFTVSGFAQVRTWVSPTGLDSNPCSRSSPCRNFNAAINAVADGGEVVVLDSGGYGVTAISKSVSIIVPEGIHAAIAPTTGTAIEISFAQKVVLRGLYLNNQGASAHGIQINSGTRVFIERTTIDGFNSSSIIAAGINSTAPGVRLHLSEVVVRNCYRGTQINSSNFEIFVDHSRFEGNTNQGMAIFDGVTATIQDSIFIDNGNAGLLVNPPTGAAYASVQRCTFAANFWGIYAPAAGTAVVDVANSLIASNLISIQAGSGDAINSHGGNIVVNNGTTNDFTNTFVPS